METTITPYDKSKKNVYNNSFRLWTRRYLLTVVNANRLQWVEACGRWGSGESGGCSFKQQGWGGEANRAVGVSYFLKILNFSLLSEHVIISNSSLVLLFLFLLYVPSPLPTGEHLLTQAHDHILFSLMSFQDTPNGLSFLCALPPGIHCI